MTTFLLILISIPVITTVIFVLGVIWLFPLTQLKKYRFHIKNGQIVVSEK